MIALEIEAKYSIPDEQIFQRLLDVTALAGFGLGAGSVLELCDCYLDTTDRAILASGYGCRLRSQGGLYLATLKGLGGATGGLHHREEYEVMLPGPLPPRDWPPGAARDLALRLCDDQSLVPLFDIVQTRYSRPVHCQDRTVAELNLDRVQVHQGDVIVAAYLELEAELLPQGTEEELRRLAANLKEEWGLVPENRSKFERALALTDPQRSLVEETASGMEAQSSPLHHRVVASASQESRESEIELLESPGINADDPMSEAGRKTFRFHFRRMVYHEPGTRLGEDIEALHDMRVATRRMRSAFRVFGEYYRTRTIAPHQKGLKRTGRALGRVRDLDVFREKILAYLATLPQSEQSSLDSLLVALEARWEAARERMITYLDSEKYARFKERFGEFVETEGLGSRPAALEDGEPRPYRLRHVAPVVIYGRLASVRAYDEWVSIPDPPRERLHALRIACKRLRYTLEFFLEVLGPNAKEVVDEVVALQDHLGALQDAVVASAILRDFLLWGTWGRDIPEGQPPVEGGLPSEPGVEAYLAAQQAELQHLLETFPQAWQRLKGVEFSKLVAEVVSVL